jgi:hypothetical protein
MGTDLTLKGKLVSTLGWKKKGSSVKVLINPSLHKYIFNRKAKHFIFTPSPPPPPPEKKNEQCKSRSDGIDVMGNLDLH